MGPAKCRTRVWGRGRCVRVQVEVDEKHLLFTCLHRRAKARHDTIAGLSLGPFGSARFDTRLSGVAVLIERAGGETWQWGPGRWQLRWKRSILQRPRAAQRAAGEVVILEDTPLDPGRKQSNQRREVLKGPRANQESAQRAVLV